MTENEAGRTADEAGLMRHALDRDAWNSRRSMNEMHSSEARFIRHPEDFPARVRRARWPGGRAWRSEGRSGHWGLLLRFKRSVAPGTPLSVAIDAGGERHRFLTEVVMTRPTDSRFEVGLCVGDEDEAFRLRMVEQLLHIEAYRRRVQEREGRMLSSECAAREWIERYAGSFPST